MTRMMLMAAALTALGGAATAQGAPGPLMGPPSFETLDADGSGALSLEEMTGAAESRFEAVDGNGDGVLSAEEVAAAIVAAAEARAADISERMIARMDVDRDGALSSGEIGARMPNPTAMFGRLDADDDGEVSAEEFEAGPGMRGGPGGRHFFDRAGEDRGPGFRGGDRHWGPGFGDGDRDWGPHFGEGERPVPPAPEDGSDEGGAGDEG
ncbi:EF-hand domain-containing protein [Pseudoroseicyclus tamaricis]|uniref:Calcium-binding protein n=1 Tax=Pseudoroseicyclus tamaricis TaxID=2705421 RepID=A0A6B2JR04_9RHOB|nr:calcium-binding protein [Pseudoroseicyclus tamaricis]NDV00415.1 calcium-binding protein [Pseudoroseicyclus tamaricis]